MANRIKLPPGYTFVSAFKKGLNLHELKSQNENDHELLQSKEIVCIGLTSLSLSRRINRKNGDSKKKISI